MKATKSTESSLCMKRSIKGHCPHCGEGRLMRDWFRVNVRCPSCDATLPVAEGAFLGSMAINYGMVVFGLIPLWLLLWWGSEWGISILTWGAMALAVVGPILLYPFAWRIWIALGVTVLKDDDQNP